VKDNKKKIKK